MPENFEALRRHIVQLVPLVPEDQLAAIHRGLDRLIHPPQPSVPPDVSLPFFAYGQFNLGGPAYFQIHPFVDRAMFASVEGTLHERDAMPMLRFGLPDSRQIDGALLWYKDGEAGAAYTKIAKFEPGSFYRWDTIHLFGDTANVLVAKDPPRVGDKELTERWSGWDDPYFTIALDKVDRLVAQAGSPKGGPTVQDRQLDLHLAYALLWTSIERFLALRYGFTGQGNVMAYVNKLAEEPSFTQALDDAPIEKVRTVYRSDSPGSKEVLDPKRDSSTKAKKAVGYYYQVRSNAMHRGKAVLADYETLYLSVTELRSIFRKLLEATRVEAAQTRSEVLAR